MIVIHRRTDNYDIKCYTVCSLSCSRTTYTANVGMSACVTPPAVHILSTGCRQNFYSSSRYSYR